MYENGQLDATDRERLSLACERMEEIVKEDTVCEPYRTYFRHLVNRLALTGILENDGKKLYGPEYITGHTLEELEENNREYYKDLTDEGYQKSYCNPGYAAGVLGKDYGPLLSALATDHTRVIQLVREGRLEELLIWMELLLQIYGMFEEDALPTATALQRTVTEYYYDYADQLVPYRVREMYDPSLSFCTDIAMKSDLTDLRYLYQYGDYITENERKTAQYLNGLSEERIEALAFTYTDGYREGFEIARIDLSKKRYVNLHYAIGQERMIRAAVQQFEALGLTPVIYRPATSLVNRKGGRRSGVQATSPNRQFDYDHRYDDALFFDAEFMNRKLEELKRGYEEMKAFTDLYAGPAVVETFGETPFHPVTCQEAYEYGPQQQKLSVEYTRKSSTITNQYINREEYSFTIIAYPIPEIGDTFPEIFDEIVKVNTLDKRMYREIQETMIQVLNRAEYVRVLGRGDNCTDMHVCMHEMEHPDRETNFENCLADVNIPLGEVFTSPKLTGTHGVLHVSEVYLNGLKYVDLQIHFADGKITSYTCDNYAEEEENQKYIHTNLLGNRETLPIGEFAIGTNTTAYAMAARYGIVHKLPILIVEKMGPHFAVGDTCYSYSEENRLYNPDGKEIVAKDNEISILRKTEPEKAYYNCHTDITIPYDEIGAIVAVTAEGAETEIMKDGRFVLAGTEALNQPLLTLQGSKKEVK